jgi:hypothetical protein
LPLEPRDEGAAVHQGRRSSADRPAGASEHSLRGLCSECSPRAYVPCLNAQRKSRTGLTGQHGSPVAEARPESRRNGSGRAPRRPGHMLSSGWLGRRAARQRRTSSLTETLEPRCFQGRPSRVCTRASAPATLSAWLSVALGSPSPPAADPARELARRRGHHPPGRRAGRVHDVAGGGTGGAVLTSRGTR